MPRRRTRRRFKNRRAYIGAIARTPRIQRRARRIDGAMTRANRKGFIAGLKRGQNESRGYRR